MKIVIILLILFICNLGFSQTEATIDFKRFNSPNSPFLESYISIFNGSIKYVPNEEGLDRCKIEILQMLKQNGRIIDFQKIILTNKGTGSEDLYNDPLHQHRFFVKNGTYEYEVEIKDLLNGAAEKFVFTKTIDIHFDGNIAISDIELLESFWKATEQTSTTSKSGIEMVPFNSNYFSPAIEKIAYYFEIYNSDQEFGPEGKYVLQHFIESYERGVIAGSFNKLSKEKTNPVNATMNVFEIGTLPTGNYNLVVQVKDRNNEIITEKKLRFQRLNLINDISPENLKDVSLTGKFTKKMPLDSLDEFIYCLRPISSIGEMNIVDHQLKMMSDTLKLQFIYSFWYNRNIEDPARGWREYKSQVRNVDKMFGTPVKEGYETDRGRIFLKYGAPNTVADRPQAVNSYPYQIWHYYKIGKFNDKRFVFYDRDLITNDYMLLHSDLIGEIRNPRWKIALQKRTIPGGNIDNINTIDQYGDQTGDLFSDP